MVVPTAGPPRRQTNAKPSLKGRFRAATRKTFSAGVLSAWTAVSLSQGAPSTSVDVQSLRKYVGTYEWGPDHFIFLQMWSEFRGKNGLVAFDEYGEVRTLFPSEDGQFVTGPGAAVPSPIESRIAFSHDASGRVGSLRWQRGDSVARTARRIENEKREEVSFANRDIHLAGTLICPLSPGKHPAVVLVPASGAEDREYLLPFAHFLVRHGMAVLGYDKRGVGGSTGDWRTESFDDLASDAVAAIEFLKTRRDIDPSQMGMLGWSQAGWVMPLAAAKRKDIAF